MPKVRGSFTKFWKAQFCEAISRKQFWILRCRKIRNRRHRLARKWKCPILCALRRKMKKRNEKRRVRRNRFRSNVATPCHLVPTLICAAEEAQEAASKRLEKEMRRLSMPFQNSCNNSHRRSNLQIFSLAKAKAKRARVSPPR